MEENEAAVAIESAARRRAARKRANKMRRRKVLNQITAWPFLLSLNLRAPFSIEDAAAVIIQRLARGVAGRAFCERLRSDRAALRAKAAGAALTVQLVYRGHKDRLKTQVKRSVE